MADITAAFATQLATADDIAGIEPGSVYYSRDNETGTYWALATFVPSEAADEEALVHFQDQPHLFTRPAGGAWAVVGPVGPIVCPSSVPQAVYAVWGLTAPQGACP